MTRRVGLSKSRITLFEQCPRRLWLSVHRPELAEESAGVRAAFADGHRVGDLPREPGLSSGWLTVSQQADTAAALQIADDGAAFAKRLMTPVSKDTLLRVVRRRVFARYDELNVIGIDDFAFRRG